MLDLDLEQQGIGRAQTPTGARRLRPGPLRERTSVGHRTRRDKVPISVRLATATTAVSTVRRLASSTATAHTRSPSTRCSRRSGCRLVDRGFVYAIAHIRGGGELGRHWYEDGKMLNKPNTFTDFVACARHLVATSWTSPDGSWHGAGLPAG